MIFVRSNESLLINKRRKRFAILARGIMIRFSSI